MATIVAEGKKFCRSLMISSRCLWFSFSKNIFIKLIFHVFVFVSVMLGQKAPEAFLYFSSVCWLFGRNLYDHFKYPIGLISSNWGGTPIEDWSSPDVLAKCGVKENRYSTICYVSMVRSTIGSTPIGGWGMGGGGHATSYSKKSFKHGKLPPTCGVQRLLISQGAGFACLSKMLLM